MNTKHFSALLTVGALAFLAGCATEPGAACVLRVLVTVAAI